MTMIELLTSTRIKDVQTLTALATTISKTFDTNLVELVLSHELVTSNILNMFATNTDICMKILRHPKCNIKVLDTVIANISNISNHTIAIAKTCIEHHKLTPRQLYTLTRLANFEILEFIVSRKHIYSLDLIPFILSKKFDTSQRMELVRIFASHIESRRVETRVEIGRYIDSMIASREERSLLRNILDKPILVL